MITHNLVQGTQEWMLHRAAHHNASDAPAMLGVSPYKTRNELIREHATGIIREVDAATQRRFDDGHRFEACARDIAESMIGEELFPCTGTEGRLSASFDGLTMLGDVAWEHKTLNATIREAFGGSGNKADLPEYLRVQMEQQCAVSGAERVLFIASEWNDDGTLVDHRECWYTPDPELRARIIAGWEQFERDVEAYVPGSDAGPAAVGHAPDQLPALRIEVTGMVTKSNLADFREKSLDVIRGINTDLQTDEHFADADKTIKWCKGVEDKLDAAKAHALSQTASIDELFRTIDAIAEETRTKRLELDKLVKHRKEAIRGEIAQAGRDAIAAHYATINATLGEYGTPVPATIGAEINAAIKGKRTVSSIRDAVDTAVANAKIAASQRAEQIRACILVLTEPANAAMAFLFHDRVALCTTKAQEDIRNLAAARIAEHEKSEAARLAAEREQIRAEEVEKIEREAMASAPAVTPVVAAAAAAHIPQPATAISKGKKAQATRPTDRQMIDVLAQHYRVHDSVVIGWLLAMNLRSESDALAEAM